MANPAKPVEVKRRMGNPGKRPLPKVSSMPVLHMAHVDPPAHLKSAGRREFEHVMATAAWLAPSDLPLLVRLCEIWDDIDAWQADVDERGMVIVTPTNGTLQAHPLLAHIRDARKQAVSMMSLLGLSPSDRGRIGAGEVQAKSKLAALIEAEKRGS